MSKEFWDKDLPLFITIVILLVFSFAAERQGDRDAQRIDALETAAAASPTAGAER